MFINPLFLFLFAVLIKVNSNLLANKFSRVYVVYIALYCGHLLIITHSSLFLSLFILLCLFHNYILGRIYCSFCSSLLFQWNKCQANNGIIRKQTQTLCVLVTHFSFSFRTAALCLEALAFVVWLFLIMHALTYLYELYIYYL